MQEADELETKQQEETNQAHPPDTEASANWDKRKQRKGEVDKYTEVLERLGLFPGTETTEIKSEDLEPAKKFQTQPFESTVTRKLDIQSTYLDLAKNQITVVIPTLNEAEAISQVLDEVMAEGFRNILVVDGYSTDKTVELAHRKGVKVDFQHGPGKAGAVMTAIERMQTPYMLFMDGDCTYDPKDIWRLLNHADQYSHVIGRRDKQSVSILHRFGNFVISLTFSLLFGTNVTDVCSGMYLLETAAAKRYRLRESGFVVEIELAAISATEDQLTEVPINYRTRVGKEKLKARYGLPILFAAFALFRRFNPVLLYSALAALSFFPAVGILGWVAQQELTAGIWHSGWALVSLVLLLAASQSITLATMSTLTKHSEERLMRQLKRVREASR